MATLFDIFGSHELVAEQHQGRPVASRLKTKDQSNLKHKTKSGALDKRVLADVGNIQSKKTDGNASVKKSINEANTTQEVLTKAPNKTSLKSHSDTLQKRISVQQTISVLHEDDDDDDDEWPEVDPQGPAFWSDDDYEDIWPKDERPTLEDFHKAINIWNEGKKNDLVMQQPSSSVSVDFDLYLPPDLPPVFPSMIYTDPLPEIAVPLPWDE